MRYYIYTRGKKIPVSEEVYKGYWKLVSREKYLLRKERANGVLPFSSFEFEDLPLENVLSDSSVDVEKLVETKLLLEQLNTALLTLSNREFEIIVALYFKEHTIKEVALQQEMSPSGVFRLRNKILNHLKKLLEK